MTELASISGVLSKKDIKRLTGTTRKGTIGPTTLYYAGVTAPIISAGVAVFTRNLMQTSDLLSTYWIWFISSLIAAFAGISWYLIFVRWSYRHTHGRGNETSIATKIQVTDEKLIVSRGEITTHIKWPAIIEVREKGHFIALIIDDSDTVLIPHHWFDNKVQRETFYTELRAHIIT